jgi:hypothetical protein
VKKIQYINARMQNCIKLCCNNWHLDEPKVSWNDNTYKLIHKKCHLKSYHSHMKHIWMTLNRIISVIYTHTHTYIHNWGFLIRILKGIWLRGPSWDKWEVQLYAMIPTLQRWGPRSSLSLGPLHKQVSSHDHEIGRAQKKVSKGCPNTPPKLCSVVIGPRV